MRHSPKTKPDPNSKAIKKSQDAQSNVSNKKLTQTWKSYRKRLAKLRASAPKIATRPIPKLTVNMDPLDGPKELRQKADILKDQEDRIKRRMQSIQRRIKTLYKKHQRERKDQKLAKRVGEMTSDDELFNEGERNPRVTTGARTSEKMRNRAAANANRLFASPGGRANGSPTVRGNTDSAAQAPKTNGSTNAPPQASPGGGSNAETGGGGTKNGNTGNSGDPNLGYQGGGTNTPNNRDDSTAAPTPSNTNVRPSTTLQPRVNAPQAGDPLHPKGTLAQQLKALKRYKEALAKRAKQLKKKQGQFIKRAKTLKKKELRRRRR